MKALRIHRLARREISEVFLHYMNAGDPRLAPDFQAKVSAALEALSRHPARYPRWRQTRVRRCLLQRFPYQLYFIEYPEFVRVFALSHTSRRPGYWKSRIAVA